MNQYSWRWVTKANNPDATDGFIFIQLLAQFLYWSFQDFNQSVCAAISMKNISYYWSNQ